MTRDEIKETAAYCESLKRKIAGKFKSVNDSLKRAHDLIEDARRLLREDQ